MRNIYKFDNNKFDINELNNYINIDNKCKKLRNNIIKLDNIDNGNYKHVIYGGTTSCSKLICSILNTLNYSNIYDHNHFIKTDTTNKYYALLTFGNVYNYPLSKKTVKNIKFKFNERPDNIYGKNIKFIVIDHYYKEGLDLYDVKYMHIFSKIHTINEETQIIGRTRRMCGHIGLPIGMKQYIYNYYEPPKHLNTFDIELTKICYYLSIDYFDISINPNSFDNNLEKLFLGQYISILKNNFTNNNIFTKYKNIKSGGNHTFTSFRNDILNIKLLQESETFTSFRNNISSKYSHLYRNNINTCYDQTFNLTPTQKFIKLYFTPFNDIKGLLCWHSTGSGKTCLALGVAANFIKNDYMIIWVSRTSLLSDIRKNLLQCYGSDTLDKNILTIGYRSFSNMLNKTNKLYQKLKNKDLSNTLIIIDEAHKLFDNSLSNLEKPDILILKEKIKNKTCKLLLMTATPFIKEPMDLIKLLNLILYNKLPEDKTQFASEYLENNLINFSKKGAIKFINKLYKNISFLDMNKDISKFAIQVRLQA